MEVESCSDFQKTVAQFTVRHRSVLDILSKNQEATARLHRSVVKAVTQCGCLSIDARKKTLPEDLSLKEWQRLAESHLQGELCEECREVVEQELGKLLFYLAALCNTLGLELGRVIASEHEKVTTLGMFNLT